MTGELLPSSIVTFLIPAVRQIRSPISLLPVKLILRTRGSLQITSPIDPPDPIEAIKFRMEQQGLTRKDMEQFLGSRQRVSDVLNRKRPLNLNMIRKLNRGLGIPAEVLIQETKGS